MSTPLTLQFINLPYRKDFRICFLSGPLSSAACHLMSVCPNLDLKNGVRVFYMESGDALSLMIIATETLHIANVLLSLVMVIFTTLKSRAHSTVLPSIVFTSFGKGAKATGNFTFSSIPSFNSSKTNKHLPNGILNMYFQYLFHHISVIFCDI
jgi:hypothetical protein